jgi:uncharacterized membrane protein
MDRKAAQARLNRIRTFNSELSLLQQDGVVTLDDVQRRAIADYHQRFLADLTARFDLDRDEGQQRMSLGMRIASILGAIALSAAVFLLFYRIWGRLSTTVQVVLLMGAPLVSVVLTEVAHRFDRTRHFVFVAAVIACACIVMNVALLGDIFAMTDSPNALAVWAAFALMIGYGYGLRLPVAVGLGLAMAFVAGSLLSWQGVDWKMFDQRPELLLPLAAVVFAFGVTLDAGTTRGFGPTYRMVGLFALLGALWMLSVDAELSVLPAGETIIKALYQVCGFAASSAAMASGLRRDWPEITNIGAVSFVVFLYTKFYQWWWDWMPAYLFFFIVGVIAIAIIVLLKRVREAIATEAA